MEARANDRQLGSPLELKKSLTLPVSRAALWEFLSDFEGVTACMPGAEMLESPDPDTWKGTITVKVGPASLVYDTVAKVRARSEADGELTLEVESTENRGRGKVDATVVARIGASGGDGTELSMTTALFVTGALKQYGAGLIGDIADRVTEQFVENVGQRVGRKGEHPAEANAPQAIGGIRMVVAAFVSATRRFLGRVWARIGFRLL